MKKFTLSILIALGMLIYRSANAQCVANATLTPTGTPGEFTITDLSSGATLPYSFFQTYVNSTIGMVTVQLQPNTTTGIIQYPADGIYSWGVTYMDNDSTTAACNDAIWDSVVVTGVGTGPMNCQASFNLQQDSTNQNQYWCWNNSTGSTPASALTYLWDFGDGNTSTQAYPTHTYNGIGVYTLCLTITDGNCTSVACDTIVITVKASGTTLNVLAPGAGLSLNEFSLIQSLKVFPNPFNDHFTLDANFIKNGEIEIGIFNLAGQKVYSSFESVSSGSNKITVNQSDLKEGMYLIRVQDLNSGSSKVIRIFKK
jgi:PKD repeat protein